MGGTIARIERITQLLHQLKYELERGFIEGDIDETISFQFVHPVSRALPGGVVRCTFQVRPALQAELDAGAKQPRLTLVKSE